MPTKSGIVYLVGAGPGDVGLITVRGLECLASSDVVVYDFLANDALLSYAQTAAERIYVGKTSSFHSSKQEDINALLVTKARQGKTVTRLKGGDPFVFGRGGEEAMYLTRHGIPFEVVPGITSAIGVPEYAGIPVTHRGISTSIHIVTGHEDPEKEAEQLNWEILGRTRGTVIFLMGVANLAKNVQKLIRNGRSPDTPIALVRWGSLPEQETLVSTLDKVVADVERTRFESPAVTIVGPVVNLRPLVHWAERRPLFGARIAVTRPAGQAYGMIDKLRRAGAEVIATPTIRIEPRHLTAPMKQVFRSLSEYQWVIFTSLNGVNAFFNRLAEADLDSRALARSRVVAIGERTAGALHPFGIRADAIASESNQEGLAEVVPVKAGHKVLIPRAASARDVLETQLDRNGARVKILPLYDTVPDTDGIAALRTALEARRLTHVTFTSASTVEFLTQVIEPRQLAALFRDVQIASIGRITTEAIRKAGLRVRIEPKKTSADALADAIITQWQKPARSRTVPQE